MQVLIFTDERTSWSMCGVTSRCWCCYVMWMSRELAQQLSEIFSGRTRVHLRMNCCFSYVILVYYIHNNKATIQFLNVTLFTYRYCRFLLECVVVRKNKHGNLKIIVKHHSNYTKTECYFIKMLKVDDHVL